MTNSPNNSKIPFLAFAQSEADRNTLTEFARAHDWNENCVLQGDIASAAQHLKTNASPELLLVEIPNAEDAPKLLDALADVCAAGTKVIVIGMVNEYSFFCWLTSIGIFSYLLRPLTLETLETTYKKSLPQITAPATSETKKSAKTIAIMGARGGVGTSTIALNLAGIFAEYSEQKIALVDIDPQNGTLALMLDIEPARGLRDALEKPDRIDALFIDRVMSKAHKNLSVMSTEESIQEPINIHEETAEILLKELTAKYDIVVLDIPRHLNQFSRECLRLADEVVLVAELNLQSLRDVLRVSDLLQETLKKPAPIVTINKMGAAPKSEISPSDFDKGIAPLKIAEKIPYTTDIFMQIGIDIPAIVSAKHASVKPLQSLAKQLIPEIIFPENEQKNGLLGFLKKK